MKLVQFIAAGLVATGAVEGARRGPCGKFKFASQEYIDCRQNLLAKMKNNNSNNENSNSNNRPNPGFLGSNGPWNGNQQRPKPFFGQIMADKEMKELGSQRWRREAVSDM